MKRLMMMVPAALVVLGAVTGVAAVAAPASTSTTTAEWLLQATWGKPGLTYHTVSHHPTQEACEAARVEYRKHQQLGQYSRCILA